MKERWGRIWVWLEKSPLLPFLQFIKFGLVGLSNTAISYSIDQLGYYVIFRGCDFERTVSLLGKAGLPVTGEQIRVVVVTAVSFLISICNSYYWNSRYVFRSGERLTSEQHLRAFLRMAACYALTGLIISPVLKILLVRAGMPYWMTGIVNLVVTVPLNYLLNRIWAFGKGSGSNRKTEIQGSKNCL